MRSRESVSRRLRLLELPDEAKQKLADGKMDAGAAVELVGLEPGRYRRAVEEIRHKHELGIKLTRDIVRAAKDESKSAGPIPGEEWSPATNSEEPVSVSAAPEVKPRPLQPASEEIPDPTSDPSSEVPPSADSVDAQVELGETCDPEADTPMPKPSPKKSVTNSAVPDVLSCPHCGKHVMLVIGKDGCCRLEALQ